MRPTNSILDVAPALRPDVEKRFWAKVAKGEGCWIWKGSSCGGYGRFKPVQGLNVMAHRMAFELVKGRIPEGLTLDHLCRNRAYVNPDHMEAVSNKENILRGIGPTAQNARKQFCPQGHPLDGDNLDPWFLMIGMRNCLTCGRIQGRDYMRKWSQTHKRNPAYHRAWWNKHKDKINATRKGKKD